MCTPLNAFCDQSGDQSGGQGVEKPEIRVEVAREKKEKAFFPENFLSLFTRLKGA